MNPSYPVYVISKGRAGPRQTSRMLEKASIPYQIVVELQEQPSYEAVIDPRKILTLPFSNLGQGSIPARNWVWEHLIAKGHKRHWILDDNISGLSYFNRNQIAYLRTGTGFAVMEQFADRYTNVALCGPEYDFFMPKKVKYVDPVRFNTRIYSCILIDNSLPFRWRGRYNEDTDLSLRCLKTGFCTILFLSFLQKKSATMTMTGGNTDELYRQDAGFDGRLEMARSLQRQHPDVVKITRKWGRWQHQVDYRPFKGNELIRKPGIVIPQGVNNYGMVLKTAEPRRSSDPAARTPGTRLDDRMLSCQQDTKQDS